MNKSNETKRREFNIRDESQDRRYFAIIPNFIVNHSTLAERGFYLTLKRIAGEDGDVCYSAAKLGEMCGISKRTVYRLIGSLVKRNWIRKSGVVETGYKPRTTYSIVDLWRLNIDFYEAKKRDRVISGTNKSADLTRSIRQENTNKEDQGKEEPERELTAFKEKYSTLESVGESEFEEIAKIYGVSTPFVRSKFDDLVNYCESKGKHYRNYFAALRNFVKNGALQIRKEASEHVSKRGIDARNIK